MWAELDVGVLVSRQGLIIRVLGDPLYFSTVLPISRIGSPGAEVRLGPSTDPVNPARYSCYVVINAVGERVCVCVQAASESHLTLNLALAVTADWPSECSFFFFNHIPDWGLLVRTVVGFVV